MNVNVRDPLLLPHQVEKSAPRSPQGQSHAAAYSDPSALSWSAAQYPPMGLISTCSATQAVPFDWKPDAHASTAHRPEMHETARALSIEVQSVPTARPGRA
jgi:hypothetical protein